MPLVSSTAAAINWKSKWFQSLKKNLHPHHARNFQCDNNETLKNIEKYLEKDDLNEVEKCQVKVQKSQS